MILCTGFRDVDRHLLRLLLLRCLLGLFSRKRKGEAYQESSEERNNSPNQSSCIHVSSLSIAFQFRQEVPPPCSDNYTSDSFHFGHPWCKVLPSGAILPCIRLPGEMLLTNLQFA